VGSLIALVQVVYKQPGSSFSFPVHHLHTANIKYCENLKSCSLLLYDIPPTDNFNKDMAITGK
jgi:hypothetical protein